MNFEQLKDILKNTGDLDLLSDSNCISEFVGLGWRAKEEEVTSKLKELGIGPIQYVDEMDGQEEVWRVLHFPDHGIYIKIVGSYDSYDSVNEFEDWDEVYQVFPKIIQKVVYLTEDESDRPAEIKIIHEDASDGSYSY